MQLKLGKKNEGIERKEKLCIAEIPFGLKARTGSGNAGLWPQQSATAADSCWEIVSSEENGSHQAGTWLYSSVAADFG